MVSLNNKIVSKKEFVFIYVFQAINEEVMIKFEYYYFVTA